MKVVFTQTIQGVGIVGEERDVKAGYARNFLFPRRLAILPTDPRAKDLRGERQAAETAMGAQKRVLSELADGWRGQTFTTKARASAEGVLYGSVGVKEIRKLLGRDDLQFETSAVKEVGTHALKLRFIDGTIVPITLIVEPETSK